MSRATVLAEDVEWVVKTLTVNLEASRQRADYNSFYQQPDGKVVPQPTGPPSYALSRRQLIEDIAEYLSERMRHG